jgi:putative restriction endonuclease
MLRADIRKKFDFSSRNSFEFPRKRSAGGKYGKMNSWWVNHKQTFRHEFLGKYIWSPKLKKNGAVNPFYETMREVSPGDVVFSFADGLIKGFGVARTHCYTSPQPDEFGHIGHSRHNVGWRVDVDFLPIAPPVKPAHHMAAIGPTLPSKYSPLSQAGLGY